MKTCPNCKATVTPGLVSCNSCGTPLSQDQNTEGFCGNCGAALSSKYDPCLHCGHVKTVLASSDTKNIASNTIKWIVIGAIAVAVILSIPYMTTLLSDLNLDIFSSIAPTLQTTTKPIASKCQMSNDRYDVDIDGEVLSPGGYVWWTLCTDRTIEYSFTTGNNIDGFLIFILTPDTSAKMFIDSREGNYYTCEDYEQAWSTKSGSCNIALGSKIVIYNHESNTISIDGRIRTR